MEVIRIENTKNRIIRDITVIVMGFLHYYKNAMAEPIPIEINLKHKYFDRFNLMVEQVDGSHCVEIALQAFIKGDLIQIRSNIDKNMPEKYIRDIVRGLVIELMYTVSTGA